MDAPGQPASNIGLEARLSRRAGLAGVEADVLTVDFAALADAAGAGLRVVGNLPYNISTPVLFHLLDATDHTEDQHEVWLGISDAEVRADGQFEQGRHHRTDRSEEQGHRTGLPRRSGQRSHAHLSGSTLDRHGGDVLSGRSIPRPPDFGQSPTRRQREALGDRWPLPG